MRLKDANALDEIERGNILGEREDGVFEENEASLNIAKKFGPVLSALGGLIAKILELGAKEIELLARNLWLLAVVIAYFIYEYKARGGQRTRIARLGEAHKSSK